MDSERPLPQVTPEQPAPPQSLEVSSVSGPEQQVGLAHEQAERRADAALAASGPVLPTPVVPVQPDPMTTALQEDDASQAGAAPLIAGDDDLIERAWVDKAKQIIAATKDDPHQREEQIARLQADYLRKRYGREIGMRTQ